MGQVGTNSDQSHRNDGVQQPRRHACEERQGHGSVQCDRDALSPLASGGDSRGPRPVALPPEGEAHCESGSPATQGPSGALSHCSCPASPRAAQSKFHWLRRGPPPFWAILSCPGSEVSTCSWFLTFPLCFLLSFIAKPMRRLGVMWV